MLTVRVTAGVILTTSTEKCNHVPNRYRFPAKTRLAGRSDNDGSLSVSAYRGIGSETVRRPVVIAGRDPNKAMAGSRLHTGTPAVRFCASRMDAYGCLTTRNLRDNNMAMGKVTATEIRTALKLRYPSGSHALLWEVAPSTGGGTRYADAVAFGLWASHGHAIEGIEIKVSRSDFLSEMKQPEKSEPVMRFCNRWWLACPSGMVSADEIPTTWGLLEMLDNGTLRQKVKAPRLDPVAPTLGFMASLIRRSSGMDEEMANAELGKRVIAAVQSKTESLEKKYMEQAHRRVQDAEEALMLLANIKKETGIDLLDFRWSGSSLVEGMKLFSKLGCRYDGLTNLRRKMNELCSEIDSLGIEP